VAPPRIKIVCFDIGGVLVRHCRTWREGCAAAGLDVREGSESDEAGRERKKLSERLVCGQIGMEEFCRLMSMTTGGLYTPVEIERLHHHWLGAEYHGVGPVVRRLIDAAKVQTGVLSNTNVGHWARLDPRGGVSAEYPTVSLLGNKYASHLLGMAKPMPQIYQKFEELSGFQGPEILFLEDMPENQAAAAARGWQVAPIDYTRETAGQIDGALVEAGLV